MRFFHVTELSNLESIIQQGLSPRIGPRSAELGESEPLVYLFDSLAMVEDALMGWLGEAFEEDIELIVMEFDLDENLLSKQDDQFEYTSDVSIDPMSLCGLYNEYLKKIPNINTIISSAENLQNTLKR